MSAVEVPVAEPRSPSEVGERAEAHVAAALLARGYSVYAPVFGSHDRVDLVCDDGITLRRLQCKTSRFVNGSILFSTCSNSKGVRRDYEGEVDAFGVYSPDLGRVYLVPASGLPKRACTLRLAPTRNGQASGVRWAADFCVSGDHSSRPIEAMAASDLGNEPP